MVKDVYTGIRAQAHLTVQFRFLTALCLVVFINAKVSCDASNLEYSLISYFQRPVTSDSSFTSELATKKRFHFISKVLHSPKYKVFTIEVQLWRIASSLFHIRVHDIVFFTLRMARFFLLLNGPHILVFLQQYVPIKVSYKVQKVKYYSSMKYQKEWDNE